MDRTGMKIIFTNKNTFDIVNELKQKQGKNIWICGGANIIQQLIKADLIDEYYISVIPTILGSGIRLFGTNLKAMLALRSNLGRFSVLYLNYDRTYCYFESNS